MSSETLWCIRKRPNMLSDIFYLVLLLFLSTLAARWLFGPKLIPGIPYNKQHWWMPYGDIISLGIHWFRTGEVFDWMSLQCKRHRSSMVQLFIPSFSLTTPVLIVADLREIEDIVTRRGHEIDRASFMGDMFGVLVPRATIGMKTDAAFKKQRRLWNCMLAPDFLNEVAAPAFYYSIQQLIDLWQTKRELAPDTAFEVGLDLRQAALDGMWQMITGTGLNLMDAMRSGLKPQTRISSKDIKTDFFSKKSAFPQFYQAFGTMYTCLDWVVTGFSLRFYRFIFKNTYALPRAERVKDDILQGIINDSRDRILYGTKTPNCALDRVLLKEMSLSGNSGHAAEDASLRDEILELLITGHETTASTTAWAMKYLTDNPEAQDMLHQCLTTAFPTSCSGNLPSAREIMKAQLPYLDAVIAEALRLSNTGPISFRETMKECEILGRVIPAHTTLLLMTAGPSYNVPCDQRPVVPEHARSASCQLKANRKWEWDSKFSIDRFVPDRWLSTEGTFDPQAGPSLPFSAGPRGCFGSKIALLELRLMIAMIFLSFNLPKLSPELSRYSAVDLLTRRPACCYVNPGDRLLQAAA